MHFRSFLAGFLGSLALLVFLFPVRVQAATCTIASDEVIDQVYVDSHSCSSIEITGNVSTTWVGTIDLQADGGGAGSGVVTVKSGNTMTLGESSLLVLGSDDDLVVEVGATTTQTGEDPVGLQIQARNITIEGALSATEKGCRQAGSGGDNGYGVDPITGICGYATGGYGHGGGGGGAGGGGGSYASIGGGGGSSGAGGNVIYGNSFVPTFLGSGGATGYYGTAFGGAGGGRVSVTSTGVLTIDGVVTADGGDGRYDGSYNGGGGGSGGSILISAGTLAGAGNVSADGGDGNHGGGGGSGGRVAIYYAARTTFNVAHVSAQKGLGGPDGSFGNGVDGGYGTTFLLDRLVDDGAGTVSISTAFDFPSSGDYTRDAFTFVSGTVLRCLTSDPTLTVSSTAWLTLSGVTWTCDRSLTEVTLGSDTGISTTNTTLTFSAATSVNIVAPTWTNATTSITLSRSGARATWDISSDLTLNNLTFSTTDAGTTDLLGGALFLPEHISLTMVSSTIFANVSSTSLTALSIDSSSRLSAMARGCPRSLGAYDGFGPDPVTGVCAVASGGYGSGGGGSGAGGSGAAHGGFGGDTGGIAGSASTYGSSTYPILFGSSGGGGYHIDSAPGGAAGGLIYLVVSGEVLIDGALDADGTEGIYSGAWTGGGGGSGGSVYLSAGSLMGAGAIRARGGAGADGGVGGGGGGGGRIALVYGALSFSGTSSTEGGAGGAGGMGMAGGVGTVYRSHLNTAPNAPLGLAPATLVDGSTTSTNVPAFTFSLSDPDGSDTVQYWIQIDDSSDFSSPIVDYVSALGAQGPATFTVGQPESGGVYAFGSSGQTLADGSYYWRVKTLDEGTAASSFSTAHSGAVAFIVDGGARAVQFAYGDGSGAETVTATSVRVVLDVPHFEDVTVDYALSGTATGGGVDYTLAAGTATISAGETSTTIPLIITNDVVSETSESVILTLSSPHGANTSLGSNTIFTYTILDNEVAGVALSKTSAAVTEGGATDSYTIVLNTAPTSTVQVVLTSPSAQFTLSTTTLTFATTTWNIPQSVTLTAVDDAVVESPTSGTITHGVSSTGSFYTADLAISSVAVLVTDNDTSGGGGGGSGGGGGGGGSGGGGGGAGGGGGGATTNVATLGQSFPVSLPDIVPVVVHPEPPVILPPPVQPIVDTIDPVLDKQAREQIGRDATEFGLKVYGGQLDLYAKFMAQGVSDVTERMGMGERRALLRDVLQVIGYRATEEDFQRMATGQVPRTRMIQNEQKQLPEVRKAFRTIFGRDPKFKNAAENLAWNTLMYRIRFTRDLQKEQRGIQAYKKTFHRVPVTPFDWSLVRVWGYVR